MQRYFTKLTDHNSRTGTVVLLLSMASTAVLRVVNVMLPSILTAVLFLASLAVLSVSLIAFECRELTNSRKDTL